MARERPTTWRLWPLAVIVLLGVRAGYAQAPAEFSPFEIEGRALYDKILSASAGLDPDTLRTEPIRGAHVAAFDPSTGLLVAAAATDAAGGFALPVPGPGPYRIRVSAVLDREGVVVRDNTANDAIWSVSAYAVAGETTVLRASDETRVAGAFNILDTIRRANAFVRRLDPEAGLPPLNVFWSPLNTDDPETVSGVFVGGTWFDPDRNAAIVLGDRDSDSDEFDDSVILHEYAHFLSARFSADDSIGGPHSPGDVLDPRVAWSEGWANFFSALVTGDAVYRDSYGPAGSFVLEYDLESNLPGNERPGYWSERLVHAILWDLADAGEEPGDTIEASPEALWHAFRRLADAAFVYLPSFLDVLTESGAVDATAVEQLARVHFIDYAAGRRMTPSFPKRIEGDVATGELDSWTTGRTNLAQSAHLYAFETSGGSVTIELDITGLGPARNPDANDMDLFLMDIRGGLLYWSNGGGDGESERIATFLPAGTYVAEVRSFFGREPGVGEEFNSGAYRLRITRP